MRSRWLLSVTACVLCTGTAAAQPTKPPRSSTGEPRAVLPADPTAPVNKLAERATLRGFAGADEMRSIVPAVGRTLAPPESSPRGYAPDRHAPRVGFDAGLSHDRALLRVQPGEKTNLIPEAAANRDFSAPTTGRQELPVRPVGPTDRSGTQAPRNSGR